MKKIKLLLALLPLFTLCSCAEEERAKISVSKEEFKIGQLLRIFNYGELVDEYAFMSTYVGKDGYIYTINSLGYAEMTYTINFYSTNKSIIVNLSNDMLGSRKDTVNTYVSSGLSYVLYDETAK